MKHEISQSLYAYWNAVRAKRAAPRRFEIEPSQIASILPSTFILERQDSETFRFRLAGTALCDAFGRELRETNFLGLWSEDHRATIERLLASVTLHAGVGQVDFTAGPSAGGQQPVAFEAILLPLVHTRDSIDRILGAISPANVPDWLGHDPLADWRLTASDVIWPVGRPTPAFDALHRQMPFLPHVRKARIVRSDRRQFRVYDGGLTKPGTD